MNFETRRMYVADLRARMRELRDRDEGGEMLSLSEARELFDLPKRIEAQETRLKEQELERDAKFMRKALPTEPSGYARSSAAYRGNIGEQMLEREEVRQREMPVREDPDVTRQRELGEIVVRILAGGEVSREDVVRLKRAKREDFLRVGGLAEATRLAMKRLVQRVIARTPAEI